MRIHHLALCFLLSLPGSALAYNHAMDESIQQALAFFKKVAEPPLKLKGQLADGSHKCYLGVRYFWDVEPGIYKDVLLFILTDGDDVQFPEGEALEFFPRLDRKPTTHIVALLSIVSEESGKILDMSAPGINRFSFSGSEMFADYQGVEGGRNGMRIVFADGRITRASGTDPEGKQIDCGF